MQSDAALGVGILQPRWVSAGVVMLAALFFVGGMLVFGRGLDNPFVSDDWIFLLQASQAKGVGDVLSLAALTGAHFVRPIQSLVTWSLYCAFGLQPVPYHLASLLLHLLNTALVWAFVRRLARLAGVGGGTRLTLAVSSALLFMLNWRQHEAVFWLSAINEPLSACLRLATLLSALAWMRRPRLRVGLYGLSLTFMALALFAKESAVALPLELVVLSVYLWHTRLRPCGRRPSWVLLAPFALITLVWLASYVSARGVAADGTIKRSGLELMHASLSEWLLRSLQYFDGHYIGGTVLAQHTLFLTLQALVLVFLAALAVRRAKFLWVFALLWTLVAALPNVAAVPTELAALRRPLLSLSVFGDRYLYYSAAGAGLFLMASLLWIGQAAWPAGWAWPAGAQTATAGLVVLMLALNLARLAVHESEWEHAGRIGMAIVQVAVHDMAGKTGTLCLVNLPDSFRGKYIFRNGIGEAFVLADPAARYAIKKLADANTQAQASSCTIVLDVDLIAPSLVNR